MQSTSSQTATIVQPGQGKTFSFFGHTITCKFSDTNQNAGIYELVGTSSSGIPPLHTHPWDEWFYFLEGDVMVQVGKQLVQATPGCVVNLPTGVPHTFAIQSPQAKFLVWVSDAAAQRYIEELLEAGGDKELTPDQVMAIGQKHHICAVQSDSEG